MLETSIPRSRAICSTVVSCCRPSNAASTMLCGLVEPRLFVRMSAIPAHSMMARTAPPAITPAPGAAGFINNFPAPCEPTTSCGIVPPVIGMLTMLRRAPSTAFRTASDTSFALPVAKPTRPCPSPTATSALNENRRPPFTTFATRLIAITFSTSSLPPSPRPPSRSRPLPSPRPPPPPPPAPPPTSSGAAATSRAAATAWTFLRRLLRCRRSCFGILVFCHLLKLQPALAGSVGHTFHAAVILVSSSVKDNPLHAGIFCLRSEPLSDFNRSLRRFSFESRIGHRHDRALCRVIHELRIDMLDRTIYNEARTLRAANHLLSQSEVTARTQLIARPWSGHLRHYLAPTFPAFPALRRICSPTYLIPLPLYGSGGLMVRSSAATWPTISLFAPSIMIDVGCGALSLIPFG